MSFEESVARLIERQTDRFYGKYRGIVATNVDESGQGRLTAIVPEVLGVVPSSSALPCTPYAGVQAGLFTVPAVGSGVWIEFEAGDVTRPVWSGCWWGSAEVPLNESGNTATFVNKVLRTDTGLMLAFNDATQTITMTDKTGLNVISMALGRIDVTGKTNRHDRSAADQARRRGQCIRRCSATTCSSISISSWRCSTATCIRASSQRDSFR